MNDPELIRESLRLVSNPNLMQEHMRNVDRAMSNLESLPGGFNALRQIYENVQQPLMNATAQGRNADNPFAALFNTPPSTAATQTNPTSAAPPPSGAVNTAPLPNPWAPVTSSPPATAAVPPTTTPPANNPLGGGSGNLPGTNVPKTKKCERMRGCM